METLTRPLTRQEIEDEVLEKWNLKELTSGRRHVATLETMWDYAFDLRRAKNIDADYLMQTARRADYVLLRKAGEDAYSTIWGAKGVESRGRADTSFPDGAEVCCIIVKNDIQALLVQTMVCLGPFAGAPDYQAALTKALSGKREDVSVAMAALTICLRRTLTLPPLNAETQRDFEAEALPLIDQVEARAAAAGRTYDEFVPPSSIWPKLREELKPASTDNLVLPKAKSGGISK